MFLQTSEVFFLRIFGFLDVVSLEETSKVSTFELFLILITD